EVHKTSCDGKTPLLSIAETLNIRALGQLAHDVVEHMRGNGGGAIALGPGGHRLDQLHVEVGRSKLKLVVARREEDVGEDRDGIPPLDHARHMAKRLGKGWFFYGKPHG